MNPTTTTTDERTRHELDPNHPDVLLMIKILSGWWIQQGWLSSADVRDIAKVHCDTEWSERRVRLLARASAGQIGSGQDGYKLVRLMTHEEKEHAANWLDHQADDMHLRADQIRKVWQEQRM